GRGVPRLRPAVPPRHRRRAARLCRRVAPRRQAWRGRELATRRSPALTLPFCDPSGSIRAAPGAACLRDGRRKLEASASVELAKHTLMSGGLILAIGAVTGLLAQKI